MTTIVDAPTPTSTEDDGRERPAPAVIGLLPLVPGRADKEQCMFPTKCKWPTCSC